MRELSLLRARKASSGHRRSMLLQRLAISVVCLISLAFVAGMALVVTQGPIRIGGTSDHSTQDGAKRAVPEQVADEPQPPSVVPLTPAASEVPAPSPSAAPDPAVSSPDATPATPDAKTVPSGVHRPTAANERPAPVAEVDVHHARPRAAHHKPRGQHAPTAAKPRPHRPAHPTRPRHRPPVAHHAHHTASGHGLSLHHLLGGLFGHRPHRSSHTSHHSSHGFGHPSSHGGSGHHGSGHHGSGHHRRGR